MSSLSSREERALRVLHAAQEIASAETSLGQRARALLELETGLSRAGVAFALDYSLEHDASRATLLQLGKRLTQHSRTHVLLAGNVFVAAFRAIVLGVLGGEECHVRASSRARVMAELLLEASGGAFSLVPELHPAPGELVWAYGSDETLAELRASLPRGVLLHAHGSGFAAAAFVEPKSPCSDDELWEVAAGLTTDVVLFDQRGCLSPRILLVEGSEAFARRLVTLLCHGLADAEAQVPRGRLTAEELADARHYEAIFRFVGAFHDAGAGGVTLDPALGRIVVPPVGRYLHVTRTTALLPLLTGIGERLTTFATFGDPLLEGRVLGAIGKRRVSAFGAFQRPPLDGPVDLRPGLEPELLE